MMLNLYLFEMESALDYIMVLPSNEKELERFLKKLKSEILILEPDPATRKQIMICLKLFQELYTDFDLEEHFNKLNLHLL